MVPVSSVIAPLAQEGVIRESSSATANIQPSNVNFSNMLEGMVASANQSANFAQGVSEAFAAGARDDIHGTMIAMSKADIELRLVSNVRNKVIDAFYELWRMQI